MNINCYLTFNGNCRQAMEFYKRCLGGKLHFQTIGESPIAEKMSRKMKSYILHATLINEHFVLMASDMVSDKGLIKGNAVSLMLDCNSESDIKKYYERLSRGGEQTHPVENTFWGTLFGDLTDKFGNHWLLHFERKG